MIKKLPPYDHYFGDNSFDKTWWVYSAENSFSFEDHGLQA